MGGKSSPKADPMMGWAAVMQAQTGADWLDFSKTAYKDSMERQVGIDALTKKVTEQQIAAQEDAGKWAREDRARFKSVFEPLQDKFIEKANNWDSAERQAQVAGEAKADVANAFAQQEQARQREMASMGVNPTSGRYDASARATDTAAALAGAGAQNNARNQLRKEAMALQGDAINLGQGLGTSAANSLGLSTSAGTNAVSNSVASQQPRTAAISQMGQGYQGAIQGYAGMGNTLNQMTSLNQSAYKSDQAGLSSLASGIGGIAGLMWSDEDSKEDKRPAKGVLEALKEMPVEAWRYKEGSEGDDGGEQHVGTYAQDFKKATGLGDGKSINVIDAIGVTMGAVKELAEKVDGLQGEVKSAAKAAPRPRAKSIMRAAA